MTVLVTAIQTFQGLSSDVKPSDPAPPAGSTFLETDTGSTYVWDGAAWGILIAAGPFRANKTVTFTGAATLGAVGNVPIYTVTGSVEIVSFAPVVVTALGEAAPTATIALGLTGATTLFVAATNALAQLTLGKIWFTTTPAAVAIAIPAAFKNIWTNANLVATVGAQAVNAGAIRFDVLWRPLSATGALVAA